MRVRLIAVVGLLAACPASPAQAQQPQSVMQVFHDYVRDGRVDPCQHTTQQLQYVRDHIPPDIRQYAADYPAAIQSAIDARARGDCAKPNRAGAVTATATPGATATATPAATVTPQAPAQATTTAVAPPPAPAAAATSTPQDVAVERVADTRTSRDAPLLALAVLLALLACLALLVVSMQRLGLGDERLAGTVHAWREARWRAAGTWEDFRDWLRIGR